MKELLQYLMAVLEILQGQRRKGKEEATLVLKWILMRGDPCCSNQGSLGVAVAQERCQCEVPSKGLQFLSGSCPIDSAKLQAY